MNNKKRWTIIDTLIVVLVIVAGVAVFALSVIDAYVDAQLANFDVSPDLSMKIRPKFDTVYNTGKTAVGCQIQFNF